MPNRRAGAARAPNLPYAASSSPLRAAEKPETKSTETRGPATAFLGVFQDPLTAPRSEAGEVALGERGDLGLLVGAVDAPTRVQEVGAVRVDVVRELAPGELAGPEPVDEHEERGSRVEGQVGLADEIEAEQRAVERVVVLPRQLHVAPAVVRVVTEMLSSPGLGIRPHPEGLADGLERVRRLVVGGRQHVCDLRLQTDALLRTLALDRSDRPFPGGEVEGRRRGALVERF